MKAFLASPTLSRREKIRAVSFSIQRCFWAPLLEELIAAFWKRGYFKGARGVGLDQRSSDRLELKRCLVFAGELLYSLFFFSSDN
jgi:hypothetical protein